MSNIVLTKEELEKFINAKLLQFAEMFISPTITVTEEGLECKRIIPRFWKKLVASSAEAYATKRHSGVVTEDRHIFDILHAFWKATESDTIDNNEYWKIVNTLADKLDGLSESGALSTPIDDNGWLSAETLGCETFPFCSLRNNEGTVVDCVMVFEKHNVADIFMSITESVTESKTDKFDLGNFCDGAKLFGLMSFSRSMSLSSILHGMIMSISSIKKPASRFTHTYLAVDETGLVKIGRTSDFVERLKCLAIGNPTIKMLVVLDGDVENKLHKRFSSQNRKGEWFCLSKTDILHIVSLHKVVWKNPVYDDIISKIDVG